MTDRESKREQHVFYEISYATAKQVFDASITRFFAFYGICKDDIIGSAECLQNASFEARIMKHGSTSAMPTDALKEQASNSNGITMPSEGRFVVLVRYNRDDRNTEEAIRETTYHELGHTLSLHITQIKYPEREAEFTNPPDQTTRILLNLGDVFWQEFIAQYLAIQLITTDGQFIGYDLRDNHRLFQRLIATMRGFPETEACCENLSKYYAFALNSSLVYSDYSTPTDCGNALPSLLQELFDSLYQHCAIEKDYTASVAYTKQLGIWMYEIITECRKYPLKISFNQ